MRVKFFKIMNDGRVRKLAVDILNIEDAIPKMLTELAAIGETMENIFDITIHYNDGSVKKGVPTKNSNGKLTNIGISIF